MIRTNRWLRIVVTGLFIASLFPWYIALLFVGAFNDTQSAAYDLAGNIFMLLFLLYPIYSIAGIVFAFRKNNNYWLLCFLPIFLVLMYLVAHISD